MSIENIKKLREMTGAGMLDVKKALTATDNDLEKAVVWLRENGISKAAKKSDRIAAEGIVFSKKNDNGVVIIELNSETDFVATNDKFKEAANNIIDLILNNDVETNDFDKLNTLEIDGMKFEQYLANLTATIGEKISLRRFVKEKNNGNTLSFYNHSNSRISVIISAKDMEEDILKDISMHIAAMNPEFLSKEDIPAEKVKQEEELAKKDLEEQLKGKPENVQKGMLQGKVNKALSEIVLLEQTFVKDPSKKVKDLQGKGIILSFVRYEVGEGIEKKEENFAEEVAKQMNNN